mgnify:CR=1 FL=1|tara:strand:- start:959 stop:1333 length:375 start_codon:yes stop_codon:yes gene_type:complete
MIKFFEHAYIIMTVLFTVYSQLVMRWQVTLAGPLPADTVGKTIYVMTLLINPWVLTGILATFFAGISWILAMTKFEISYAYPFISLNYILVLAAGFLLFDESINTYKVVGSLLVVLGVIVIAKG